VATSSESGSRKHEKFKKGWKKKVGRLQRTKTGAFLEDIFQGRNVAPFREEEGVKLKRVKRKRRKETRVREKKGVRVAYFYPDLLVVGEQRKLRP